MLWIIDTSAWARRDIPAVRTFLEEMLAAGNELVLSPPVLLELLRGPRGRDVAEERRRLEEGFRVLPVDDDTFRLAADAMERLAVAGAEAHRLPITDLVTSALAHQHAAGILHFDGGYDAIAAHSGLSLAAQAVCTPEDLATSAEHSVAGRQRALKREMAGLLHGLPVTDAEAFLRRAVEDLRRADWR